MPSAGKYLLLGLLAPVLASLCDARAADGQRSLQQLRHTAWTSREGAPPEIWALAQTNDGYLWLGTGGGLYRFDGASFEKFQPLKGESLPSLNVNSLVATRSGDLWIGFASGALARLRKGHLTTFDLSLPSVPVLELSEDSAGGVWAALGEDDRGGVARFRQGRWEIFGPSRGVAPGAATSVLGAADGSVWIAAGGELGVLRPGADRFFARRRLGREQTKAEAVAGRGDMAHHRCPARSSAHHGIGYPIHDDMGRAADNAQSPSAEPSFRSAR